MRFGALTAGIAATPTIRALDATPALKARLDEALATPLLCRDLWPAPISIASIELLRRPTDFLVRVRSRDGAEGLAAGHPTVLDATWPILTKRVAPFFIGKDARDLESWCRPGRGSV